jgi:hypothetical protein
MYILNKNNICYTNTNIQQFFTSSKIIVIVKNFVMINLYSRPGLEVGSSILRSGQRGGVAAASPPL